jgi:hypothetical protein
MYAKIVLLNCPQANLARVFVLKNIFTVKFFMSKISKFWRV